MIQHDAELIWCDSSDDTIPNESDTLSDHHHDHPYVYAICTRTVIVEMKDARPASVVSRAWACVRYPPAAQIPISIPAIRTLFFRRALPRNGRNAAVAMAKRPTEKVAGSSPSCESFMTLMLLPATNDPATPNRPTNQSIEQPTSRHGRLHLLCYVLQGG